MSTGGDMTTTGVEPEMAPDPKYPDECDTCGAQDMVLVEIVLNAGDPVGLSVCFDCFDGFRSRPSDDKAAEPIAATKAVSSIDGRGTSKLEGFANGSMRLYVPRRLHRALGWAAGEQILWTVSESGAISLERASGA
jgi:hypothetical protein